MTPPKDCKELARRLVADAAPLHGRTYHDMRLAAVVLENCAFRCGELPDVIMHLSLEYDKTLYHTEPEDNR